MPLSKVTSNSVSLTTLAASGAATLSSTLGVTGAATLSSTLGVTGVTTVQAGTAALPALTTTGDTNTGIFFPAADTIGFSEGGVEAMRIDASGNVGIGTSIPSSYGGGLVVRKANTGQGVTNATAQFSDATNSALWVGHTSGATNIVADAALTFGYTNGTTTTENARITTGGNFGIGTTSPSYRLEVKGPSATAGQLSIHDGTGDTVVSGTNAASLLFQCRDSSVRTLAEIDGVHTTTNGTGGAMVFQTRISDTLAERMRIDSSGNLLVAKSATTYATAGITLNANGEGWFTVSGGAPLSINRTASDGTLVFFSQDGTNEGSISVSGTTVSYNGGHLSRWAQTTTVKNESLVKGTVLSNLDEMNVYTDAEGNPVDNEQLNKVKVSDVEGDANVAGVFVNWMHDEQHDVDEINMAMTGDMIIRIAQGVTVARGDLLMSAGDGTAKPQGDDICRSKTIAKVTSTYVTCTYEDGSYCVPCVLMAC